MSSDQQVAFDNWEQAAQQLQKQQQNKQQTTTEQQEKKEELNDAVQQQIKQQKLPVDPKVLLKQKIVQYQTMTVEQFQQLSDKVTETNLAAGKKVGNPVLKSDKDFSNYAKNLAKRFDNIVQNEDATIDDEKLSLFFQQMTLYMYKNLQWKNLHDVQAKLKVIKKQRKTQQDKRKKQLQKQARLKKTQNQGSQSQSQSVNTKQKKQEDLFGGVTNITSKQQQEQRKNKIITQAPKVEQKQEQDDDDFM